MTVLSRWEMVLGLQASPLFDWDELLPNISIVVLADHISSKFKVFVPE